MSTAVARTAQGAARLANAYAAAFVDAGNKALRDRFFAERYSTGTQLAQIRERRGLNFRIEVDGGVAPETVADVVRAGGEILVAGSAVFGPGDIAGRAKALLAAARAAKLTRT